MYLGCGRDCVPKLVKILKHFSKIVFSSIRNSISVNQFKAEVIMIYCSSPPPCGKEVFFDFFAPIFTCKLLIKQNWPVYLLTFSLFSWYILRS